MIVHALAFFWRLGTCLEFAAGQRQDERCSVEACCVIVEVKPDRLDVQIVGETLDKRGGMPPPFFFDRLRCNRRHAIKG